MTEITSDHQMAKVRSFERGYIGVHLILTGGELGLFAALDAVPEGLTAPSLAESLGLHAPYVELWCQTADALDLLDVDEAGRFRLQPHLNEVLVQSENPRNLFDSLKFTALEVSKDLVRYAAFFRSGEEFRYQEHGASISHLVAGMTKNFPQVFIGGMMKRVAGMREQLCAGARVLEIGCGAGTLACELAKQFPASYFVGVDLDRHAIELGRSRLADGGLAERVVLHETSGATFTDAAAFDYAIFIVTLHEIRADEKQAVVRNVYRLLGAEGGLINLDFSFPGAREQWRQPEFTYGVLDQYMEMVWGNRHLSRAAVRDLFERCGFRGVEQHLFNQGTFTLTVARKG